MAKTKKNNWSIWNKKKSSSPKPVVNKTIKYNKANPFLDELPSKSQEQQNVKEFKIGQLFDKNKKVVYSSDTSIPLEEPYMPAYNIYSEPTPQPVNYGIIPPTVIKTKKEYADDIENKKSDGPLTAIAKTYLQFMLEIKDTPNGTVGINNAYNNFNNQHNNDSFLNKIYNGIVNNYADDFNYDPNSPIDLLSKENKLKRLIIELNANMNPIIMKKLTSENAAQIIQQFGSMEQFATEPATIKKTALTQFFIKDMIYAYELFLTSQNGLTKNAQIRINNFEQKYGLNILSNKAYTPKGAVNAINLENLIKPVEGPFIKNPMDPNYDYGVGPDAYYADKRARKYEDRLKLNKSLGIFTLAIKSFLQFMFQLKNNPKGALLIKDVYKGVNFKDNQIYDKINIFLEQLYDAYNNVFTIDPTIPLEYIEDETNKKQFKSMLTNLYNKIDQPRLKKLENLNQDRIIDLFGSMEIFNLKSALEKKHALVNMFVTDMVKAYQELLTSTTIGSNAAQIDINNFEQRYGLNVLYEQLQAPKAIRRYQEDLKHISPIPEKYQDWNKRIKKYDKSLFDEYSSMGSIVSDRIKKNKQRVEKQQVYKENIFEPLNKPTPEEKGIYRTYHRTGYKKPMWAYEIDADAISKKEPWVTHVEKHPKTKIEQEQAKKGYLNDIKNYLKEKNDRTKYNYVPPKSTASRERRKKEDRLPKDFFYGMTKMKMKEISPNENKELKEIVPSPHPSIEEIPYYEALMRHVNEETTNVQKDLEEHGIEAEASPESSGDYNIMLDPNPKYKYKVEKNIPRTWARYAYDRAWNPLKFMGYYKTPPEYEELYDKNPNDAKRIEAIKIVNPKSIKEKVVHYDFEKFKLPKGTKAVDKINLLKSNIGFIQNVLEQPDENVLSFQDYIKSLDSKQKPPNFDEMYKANPNFADIINNNYKQAVKDERTFLQSLLEEKQKKIEKYEKIKHLPKLSTKKRKSPSPQRKTKTKKRHTLKTRMQNLLMSPLSLSSTSSAALNKYVGKKGDLLKQAEVENYEKTFGKNFLGKRWPLPPTPPNAQHTRKKHTIRTRLENLMRSPLSTASPLSESEQQLALQRENAVALNIAKHIQKPYIKATSSPKQYKTKTRKRTSKKLSQKQKLIDKGRTVQELQAADREAFEDVYDDYFTPQYGPHDANELLFRDDQLNFIGKPRRPTRAYVQPNADVINIYSKAQGQNKNWWDNQPQDASPAQPPPLVPYKFTPTRPPILQ